MIIFKKDKTLVLAEKLDKILDKLFDNSSLSSKNISMFSFTTQEQLNDMFNSEITLAEFPFLRDYLLENKFIQTDSQPNYSLTKEGLLLIISGGFAKKHISESNKNRLLIISQIAVIIAGIYYLLEIINFFYKLK